MTTSTSIIYVWIILNILKLILVHFLLTSLFFLTIIYTQITIKKHIKLRLVS